MQDDFLTSLVCSTISCIVSIHCWTILCLLRLGDSLLAKFNPFVFGDFCFSALYKNRQWVFALQPSQNTVNLFRFYCWCVPNLVPQIQKFELLTQINNATNSRRSIDILLFGASLDCVNNGLTSVYLLRMFSGRQLQHRHPSHKLWILTDDT